jgi:hypothetical protein
VRGRCTISTMRTILLLLALAPVVAAQSQAALQRFFEGKRVRVKMDMPATHQGVDYHCNKEQPVDFKVYSSRIRQFGAALRNGDEVMVTGVKVKGKNIEFQLGGGGYGTLGDDSGYVSPRSVPKSDREKDLERDIRNERDRERRDRMERELSRVRERRERDERYEREGAERETRIRRQEIAEKRLQAGSRFNIWYPEGYLKETTPTPQDLMKTLGEWVDFGALEESR